MRTGTTSIFIVVAVALHGQIPIEQARTLPIGTYVTIRGITTNGSELGSIRYVQDATAAIAVFPGSGSVNGFAPPRGADVTISGTLKLFNGLLEIDPVSSYTVHSTGNADPASQVVLPSGMGEGTESELVRINGCVLSDPDGDFTSGTHSFTSNGVSGVLYLKAGHPLVGSAVPNGVVDLIGIVSQYDPSTPAVGGYQLLPRGTLDLLPSTTIALLGQVEQTNIGPEGFTLQWATNLAGSSHVRYGTTPSFGTAISSVDMTTMHALELEDLDPASIHYTQVFSVLGTDTAWSAVSVNSTASMDPGSIIVYFNRSVDLGVANGPLAIDLGSAMDDTVKAYIDRAQITLDIAVYNTTHGGIVAAVNDAFDRGVQVRWITEASNSNSALGSLLPGIPVLYRENSAGSGMHNKFMVADADDGPNAHVLTGSSNFTNSGLLLDANNLIIIRDQALARAYRKEFNEMWGGTGAAPVPQNSRFGADKVDDTPHYFNVNGTPVQCWFSPSDGTTAKIDDALRSADQDIEFALFALTNSTLITALTDMANLPAIEVRGMVEEDDMSPSALLELLSGGVIVLPDGEPSYLHHKYAVVDHDAPGSEPLVITGSHNWSYNAETVNDENTLIIHSAALAGQFHQEWHARWTSAVGIDEDLTGSNDLHIRPNPARDRIWVAHPALTDDLATIQIIDLSGRTVMTRMGSGDQAVLDLMDLAPGTYVLQIQADRRKAERLFMRLP